MRILLLTKSFNSLTQRLFVELEARGHALSVEFDINDQVSVEAVDLFRPELIVAPYLTRRLPEAVWRRVRTLIVHPGPPGDRVGSTRRNDLHGCKFRIQEKVPRRVVSRRHCTRCFPRLPTI